MVDVTIYIPYMDPMGYSLLCLFKCAWILETYAIKIAFSMLKNHVFPVGPGMISRFGWSYCSMSNQVGID